MYLLYATKTTATKNTATQNRSASAPESKQLVATFDTEEQLRAYVQWATLRKHSDGTSDFEQGSALAGYSRWSMESAGTHSEESEHADVVHNPSPNML